MPRLRQYFPQQYTSSGNINSEFENIIRYLVAAERGGKSIPEMLAEVFDLSGTYRAQIEFRVNPDTGLEYRVGEFQNDIQGWMQIAAFSEIRGDAGSDVGFIEAPFFFNRTDVVATAGQQTVVYNLSETLDVIVWKNGLLQPRSAYSLNRDLDTVVFTPALLANDRVTIASVRNQAATDYARTDLLAGQGQVVFPYPYTPTDSVTVFRNGILQKEGSTSDYIVSFLNNTLTFTTPQVAGDNITFLRVENRALSEVVGLMTEDKYTKNGRILFDKLLIADNEIPQNKVSQLSTTLSSKANIIVSELTPEDSEVGDLWLNTGLPIPQLFYFDGQAYRSTTPATNLPTLSEQNSFKFVRVNAAGTALEYADVDKSDLVPKTFIGQAGGVAPLDSVGLIPDDFLPVIPSYLNSDLFLSGVVTDGIRNLTIVFQRVVRLKAMYYRMGTGTCNVQLLVGGVSIGSPIVVNQDNGVTTFNPEIEIDGDIPKRITVAITSAASTPTDFEFCLVYEAVAL